MTRQGRPPPADRPARRTGCAWSAPGWRFTSGISYYTCLLANALAERHDVSVILMRQLLPAPLLPGPAAGSACRAPGPPTGRPAGVLTASTGGGGARWPGRCTSCAPAGRRCWSCSGGRPPCCTPTWCWPSRAGSWAPGSSSSCTNSRTPARGGSAPVRWYGRWGLGLLLRAGPGLRGPFRGGSRRTAGRHMAARITRVAIAPHGPFDQYQLVPGPVPGRDGPLGPRSPRRRRQGRSACCSSGRSARTRAWRSLLRVFSGLHRGTKRPGCG